MADRPTIRSRFQIGYEDGSAIASANKQMQSLSFTPGTKTEFQRFRPAGFKFPTVIANSKEWTEAGMSGVPVYDELLYVLAGIMGLPVTTQLIPGTGLAYSHVFTVNTDEADTVASFVIQQGSAERAELFRNAMIREAGLTFSRSGVELSGSLIGKRFDVDGVTLTANPDVMPLVPILGSQISVRLANTAAGLGAAPALTRALGVEWRLADRFGPIWTLNAAEESYAATVETEPKGSVKLTLGADDVGMALYANLRAGDTIFLRIDTSNEPIIETTNRYGLILDTALKINGDPSEVKDQDGIMAIEWNAEWVHDATWGKAVEATLVNTQAEVEVAPDEV